MSTSAVKAVACWWRRVFFIVWFIFFVSSWHSAKQTRCGKEQREKDRKIERQRKRIVVFLSSCMGRTGAKDEEYSKSMKDSQTEASKQQEIAMQVKSTPVQRIVSHLLSTRLAIFARAHLFRLTQWYIPARCALRIERTRLGTYFERARACSSDATLVEFVLGRWKIGFEYHRFN